MNAITSFCAGWIFALLLVYFAKDETIYVPCAVPVYATNGMTLEEMDAQAALRMDAMRHCAEKITAMRGN